MRKRKGFTLAELVTAVAILAMVAGFVSVIFKSSIDGYRSAGANTEIMQKLRAITEQLNSDFEGLCKDGYLIIQIDKHPGPRKVYPDLPDEKKDFFMDRIYYFTTGDFQSWEEPDIKSNIARVFWGHDNDSLNPIDDDPLLSECRLARDVLLLTPDVSLSDSSNVSYSECKSDIENLEDPDEIINTSVSVDFSGSGPSSDPNNVRRLFCENIGEFKIEWTYGTFDSNSKIRWEQETINTANGLNCNPRPDSDAWPEAIKFTFTLYDSKRILDGGRRFSHIVYIGD